MMRGERGPRGDHGQTGDQGVPGPRGATGPGFLRSRKAQMFAFGLVIAATVGGLALLGQETKSNLEQVQLEGCQRGNITKSYLLIRSRSVTTANPSDLELAKDLNHIVSCYQTKAEGHTVVVTEPVSNQYQCIIQTQRRWPILGEDGEISYTKALPGKDGPAKQAVKPCG